MGKARRALRYVGRRGVFLLFLAELDAIIGYSLTAPLPFGLKAAQVYGPQVAVMPMSAWVGCWVGVGAVLAVAAFWHRAQSAAFSLGAALKTAWGLTYLVGWWRGELTRGYLSTAIYFTFAAVVLIVATWRENDAP